MDGARHIILKSAHVNEQNFTSRVQGLLWYKIYFPDSNTRNFMKILIVYSKNLGFLPLDLKHPHLNVGRLLVHLQLSVCGSRIFWLSLCFHIQCKCSTLSGKLWNFRLPLNNQSSVGVGFSVKVWIFPTFLKIQQWAAIAQLLVDFAIFIFFFIIVYFQASNCRKYKYAS